MTFPGNKNPAECIPSASRHSYPVSIKWYSLSSSAERKQRDRLFSFSPISFFFLLFFKKKKRWRKEAAVDLRLDTFGPKLDPGRQSCCDLLFLAGTHRDVGRGRGEEEEGGTQGKNQGRGRRWRDVSPESRLTEWSLRKELARRSPSKNNLCGHSCSGDGINMFVTVAKPLTLWSPWLMPTWECMLLPLLWPASPSSLRK